MLETNFNLSLLDQTIQCFGAYTMGIKQAIQYFHPEWSEAEITDAIRKILNASYGKRLTTI